jgi:hypothetical protein
MVRSMVLSAQSAGQQRLLWLHRSAAIGGDVGELARLRDENRRLKSENRASSRHATLTLPPGSATLPCSGVPRPPNTRSLQRTLRIYRDFFNSHRPHQGIDNRIPERRAVGGVPRNCADQISDGDLVVECERFLGGLLNSYYRKAA